MVSDRPHYYIALITFKVVIVFPPFQILRAHIHCVIMSFRALLLLIAVHAFAAHLGQIPWCVTSTNMSKFQERPINRDKTYHIALEIDDWRIDIRGEWIHLRLIFWEAHYCQQVEAQLGPQCGGWFGLNLQKRFPHSTWKSPQEQKEVPIAQVDYQFIRLFRCH